jgi:hypothetical protein
VQGNGFFHSVRIPYTGCDYDVDPEKQPEAEEESDEDESVDASETRNVVRPEPEAFQPPSRPPKFDLRAVYKKRGLQVIVKLANIELTPDKPNYDGGSWHVEGHMVNFYRKPHLIY